MRKSITVSGFAYFFAGILFIISPHITLGFLPMLLKCLIIPLLIIFFLVGRGKERFAEDKFIIAALVFSWIGDILLQVKNFGDSLFLAGLIAFLLTHICYSIVFFHAKGEFNFFRTKRMLVLVIILYGSLTIYTILPGLGSMQVPVTIYGIIITGMVIAAISRFGNVRDISYLLVFLGALLFLISDSLIAFSKFKQPFPYSSELIMSTYLVAQFMIVLGLIDQHKNQEIS